MGRGHCFDYDCESDRSMFVYRLIFVQPWYGDDDINDVAAMGGVNLAEESQRILGSTELIGRHIRSCKDEVFLHLPALQSRIRKAVAKHGLDEVSSDVAVLISHACQERLKNVLEKLAIIAEHRIDVIKVTGWHQAANRPMTFTEPSFSSSLCTDRSKVWDNKRCPGPNQVFGGAGQSRTKAPRRTRKRNAYASGEISIKGRRSGTSEAKSKGTVRCGLGPLLQAHQIKSVGLCAYFRRKRCNVQKWRNFDNGMQI